MFTEIVRPQLGKISGLLAMITTRQQMTSNNIANLHTPNFTPKHVSFEELLGNTSNQYETRLAKQMGGGGLTALLADEEDAPQGVTLQDEMMDMQKNLLYYSIATRRLSSLLNSLRTAGQVGR
jgi:flagellar basal-body rod protein FlgB